MQNKEKSKDAFYNLCLPIFEKKVNALLFHFSFSYKQKEDLVSLARVAFWETVKYFEKKNKSSCCNAEEFVLNLWPYTKKKIRGIWEDFLIQEMGGLTRYEYTIYSKIYKIYNEILMEEQEKVTPEKLAERIAQERKNSSINKILPAKYEKPRVLMHVMEKLKDFRLAYLDDFLSVLNLPDERPVPDCDLFIDIEQYHEIAKRFLAVLPAGSQRVLYRRFMKCESHHNIAKFLQVGKGISKNSLLCALNILRDQLEKHHNEEYLSICHAILDVLKEDEKRLEKIFSLVGCTEESCKYFQGLLLKLCPKNINDRKNSVFLKNSCSISKAVND